MNLFKQVRERINKLDDIIEGHDYSEQMGSEDMIELSLRLSDTARKAEAKAYEQQHAEFTDAYGKAIVSPLTHLQYMDALKWHLQLQRYDMRARRRFCDYAITHYDALAVRDRHTSQFVAVKGGFYALDDAAHPYWTIEDAVVAEWWIHVKLGETDDLGRPRNPRCEIIRYYGARSKDPEDYTTGETT